MNVQAVLRALRYLFFGLTLVYLGSAAPVRAAVVFVDEFSIPGSHLDLAAWTTEFGAPSFLGRTQLRDWVTPVAGAEFTVDNGSAELALNTFNPTGASFYGTHAKTLQSFSPGPATGYELTVRMQLTSTAQGGIVYGVYFFGCESGPCATHHDELDLEILTNYLLPGVPQYQVQLNRYAAEPLGAGHGPIVDLPAGFDPLAPHDWVIRWHQDRVAYLVDGQLLYRATDFIPQGAMQANIIAWAPAAEWPAAYDPSLQFVTDPSLDQRHVARVDFVSVTAVPTPLPGAIWLFPFALAVLGWFGAGRGKSEE